MSLKLFESPDADKEKFKCHSLVLFSWKQSDKASPRIFQDCLWGHFSLWMLADGDVLQAAIFSFALAGGQESRWAVLPSLLSVFLYMLGCSLFPLTSLSCSAFWGAAVGVPGSLGRQLPGRQRTWSKQVGFAGKICLSTPLRIELLGRIEIQVRTLLFCLGRFV